jgi:hypothetical protein
MVKYAIADNQLNPRKPIFQSQANFGCHRRGQAIPSDFVVAVQNAIAAESAA